MIVEVHEIPKPRMPDPKTTVSHKDEILLDIKAAFETKVAKFEIIGDYNYKYLARQATEVAEDYCKSVILSNARAKAKKALRKEYRDDIFIPSGYGWEHRIIKIHGVTLDDRKHVYGEIDFKFIRNLKKKFIEEAVKRIDDKKKRKKSRI